MISVEAIVTTPLQQAYQHSPLLILSTEEHRKDPDQATGLIGDEPECRLAKRQLPQPGEQVFISAAAMRSRGNAI